jgi:hypothetical protein
MATVHAQAYAAEGDDDLPEIMDDSIGLYEEDNYYNNFEVIEQSDDDKTLGGYPAYEYTSTYSADGIEYKVKEIGLKYGESLYDIIYLARADRFDKYLPQVERMIDSYKLQ